MSIASEISRIAQNVTDSLAAVADKGVTVPSGSTIDDLPDLIAQITGGGGGMNAQGYTEARKSVSSTTYMATDIALEVAATGTYEVMWSGWKSTNSSGTFGSQLYITRNGSTFTNDTAHTGFSITPCGQWIVLRNVELQKNDIIRLYARSSSTSTTMTVGGLFIVQIA